MNRKDRDDFEPNKQPEEGSASKKAYQAPSFRVERVFVTTSLSCGKIDVTQSTCGSNRKLS